MKRVYMYVSDDEYELPMIVTDTAKEMAEWVGVKKTTVESSLSKVRHGVVASSRYKEVWIDDSD